MLSGADVASHRPQSCRENLVQCRAVAFSKGLCPLLSADLPVSAVARPPWAECQCWAGGSGPQKVHPSGLWLSRTEMLAFEWHLQKWSWGPGVRLVVLLASSNPDSPEAALLTLRDNPLAH